jgi:hypothetical protein
MDCVKVPIRPVLAALTWRAARIVRALTVGVHPDDLHDHIDSNTKELHGA